MDSPFSCTTDVGNRQMLSKTMPIGTKSVYSQTWLNDSSCQNITSARFKFMSSHVTHTAVLMYMPVVKAIADTFG